VSKNFELLLKAGKGQWLEPAHRELTRNEAARVPTLASQFTPHHYEARLAERVFLLAGSKAPRAVVFSGVERGNGTTGICARVGEALAAQVNPFGCSVCLVDADQYSPRLHQVFGIADGNGLTEAILEAAPVRSVVHQLRGCNLWLLSAGGSRSKVQSGCSPELFGSLVAELRRDFGYVLIDAPPVHVNVDALLWGQVADGVILVVDSDTTRRESALEASKHFKAANVNVLGTVLNNRSFPIPESIYKRL
jgi:Mrp family chromosome partitioning ATPase